MQDDDVIKKQNMEDGIKELIKLKLMKFTRPRRLLCKGGLLEIRPDGEITSTKDHDSPFVVLQVISISANMIAMWGREAQLYMAVDEKGSIYTTETEGRDCVFVERFTQDFYNTYESYHSINNPHTNYYLTFSSVDHPIKMSDKITDMSSFYWDVPAPPQSEFGVVGDRQIKHTTTTTTRNTTEDVNNNKTYCK